MPCGGHKTSPISLLLRSAYDIVSCYGPFHYEDNHYGIKHVYIQSTLVISNSKGLSEILRDIRTSTYQVCRIEEKLIRTTTFNKYMCNWTLEVRDILKILWKRGEIAPKEQFLLFSIIFSHVVRFSSLGRTRFSLRDKRLFDISEVGIARVNCI